MNSSWRPCTNHYHKRSYDPGVLKTTYDAQYTPHKIENQTVPDARYEYKPKNGKFYDDTEYKNNYQPKPI